MHPWLQPASTLRVLVVLGLAAGVFVFDTITNLEIAVAVFYIAVVLLSVGFLRARGVIAVSFLCMGLTVLSFVLTSTGLREAGLINCAISLSAIGVTTYLALRTTSAVQGAHRAQAQLARAARVITLGELTASIAHEVNQPLAAVVTSGNACLRWIAAEPPNLEKAQQAVGRMIKDANRASDVIARVRNLVKQSPVEKEWLDAAEPVAEIVALTRGEISRNAVALQVHIADDLPRVLADRVQLEQVLLNLILNAVDALSSVDLQARKLMLRVEKNGSGGVVFEVHDSGVGLRTEELEHAFDPFYTTKTDGMGIGLTISRSIIEAHGGRIWAVANPGGGAVFRFTVPTGGAGTR